MTSRAGSAGLAAVTRAAGRENKLARYGKTFKDRAVARLLPPESASVEEVAREIGVGVETLERWRSDALSMPAREHRLSRLF